MNRRPIFAAIAAVCMLALSNQACAHGFAGKRFFPATLQTDDPFVSDELSLPTASRFRDPATADEPETRETAVAVDFAKRVTSNFGVEVGSARVRLEPEGESALTGSENLEVGVKYQFATDERQERIFSFGVGTEIGGTGSSTVGSESFNVYTPTFFFGKGFGDLSDDSPMLKPFAITGSIGVSFPSRSSIMNAGEIERNPHVLNFGFAVMYDLHYLQSFIKDIGLRAPFNRMIPIVEFSFQRPLDRGQAGETTGTINPGIIWVGQKVQLGVEAILPVNARTGKHTGVIAQLHFFLDDIFPNTLGKPLFGQ
jgi:hypothetical protein